MNPCASDSILVRLKAAYYFKRARKICLTGYCGPAFCGFRRAFAESRVRGLLRCLLRPSAEGRASACARVRAEAKSRTRRDRRARRAGMRRASPAVLRAMRGRSLRLAPGIPARICRACRCRRPSVPWSMPLPPNMPRSWPQAIQISISSCHKYVKARKGYATACLFCLPVIEYTLPEREGGHPDRKGVNKHDLCGALACSVSLCRISPPARQGVFL